MPTRRAASARPKREPSAKTAPESDKRAQEGSLLDKVAPKGSDKRGAWDVWAPRAAKLFGLVAKAALVVLVGVLYCYAVAAVVLVVAANIVPEAMVMIGNATGAAYDMGTLDLMTTVYMPSAFVVLLLAATVFWCALKGLRALVSWTRRCFSGIDGWCQGIFKKDSEKKEEGPSKGAQERDGDGR